jgi:NAD(P)-dependent dehydrogenase (short-subunit alcohol dehydrogenase family)
MSSELGSITNNEGRWDLYASSKAALDMLMKCYTAHRPDDRRAKLIVAPGWIQTEIASDDSPVRKPASLPKLRLLVTLWNRNMRQTFHPATVFSHLSR